MESIQLPNLEIAQRVLPPALLEAIAHVFAQGIQGCALVGGTALAGFYAGHRRSDDMDLFVKSEVSLRGTILAVKSLSKIGAQFRDESTTGQYYHANCELRKTHFTIDIVMDENLFKVGNFKTLQGGVCVADLTTLLKMKAATLVSRCGEKDIYDLQWLLSQFPEIGIPELIQIGKEIDRGVSIENLLASVAGTHLREAACNFSLNAKSDCRKVYTEVKKFQNDLIISLMQLAKNQPPPPLAKIVKSLKNTQSE